MWYKSKIAGLLVVVAALLVVDLVIRWASPAQAAGGQIVREPERFVAVGGFVTGGANSRDVLVRMNEWGEVDIYFFGTAGLPMHQWIPLP